jgi:hypothetical protein
LNHVEVNLKISTKVIGVGSNMRPHYHISVRIEADDALTIKREFRKWLDQAGGMTIEIKSDSGIEASDRLTNAMRNAVLCLLAECKYINEVN